MADTIKIGNLDISAFKVGSGDCKVYLGDTLLYPQGQPAFQGKWKATYQDSHTESAQCDSSSAITYGEINLTSLVSVEIGDCVTSIDFLVFYGCTSLTSVTIGNGVREIGDDAFDGCRGLTSVNIPSGVTTIGERAFYVCSNLASITVNATTPPTLGSGAFNGSTCPILVPASSVNTYKSASGWSSYASRIQAIPNS